jgi:hypothetical protein
MEKELVCKAITYIQPAIKRVYEEQGIRITFENEPWDIIAPVHAPNHDVRMTGITNVAGKWVEIITGTTTLSNREIMWKYLKNYSGLEIAKEMVPETFILNDPQDLERMKLSGETETLILKGNDHRRRGLKLVKGYTEAMALKDDYVIAQRFIYDQTRYRGTTFQLRCFLLMTLEKGIFTLHMYHDTMIVYAKPEHQTSDEFAKWITHPDNKLPDDYPAFLSELCEREGYSFEEIWWDVASVIIGITSVLSGNFGNVKSLDQSYCFQIFGSDVILKSDLSPIVCEMCKMPEMGAGNRRYGDFKDQYLRDVLKVVGIKKADEHGFIPILEIDMRQQ